MGRIKGQDRDALDFAMGVLLWITCAKRELTTLELQHALAVKRGAPKLDKGCNGVVKLLRRKL